VSNLTTFCILTCKWRRDTFSFMLEQKSLRRYGVSLAVVILSIIISMNLPPVSQSSSLFTILAGILFSAWYGGFGPGLFTTLIATISILYYLVDLRHSLDKSPNPDLLPLVLFVMISVGVVLFVSARQVAQTRLARAHEELGRLTAHMETVREEERTRLAREIHDQVGGSLSILKLDVASLHKQIQFDQTLKAKANDILKEIDGAFLTVQQIAMELRPSLLDHHGLAAAIESHLDTHCRKVDLDCEKEFDPLMNVEGPCATAIFRVFQEAFTNIIRHAQATKIVVRLRQDETGIRLVVTDNGVGLEQEQLLKPNALGLIGMRERIRPFGGTVTLVSRPGDGTTVTTLVPIIVASPSIIGAEIGAEFEADAANTLLPRTAQST